MWRNTNAQSAEIDFLQADRMAEKACIAAAHDDSIYCDDVTVRIGDANSLGSETGRQPAFGKVSNFHFCSGWNRELPEKCVAAERKAKREDNTASGEEPEYNENDCGAQPVRCLPLSRHASARAFVQPRLVSARKSHWT